MCYEFIKFKVVLIPPPGKTWEISIFSLNCFSRRAALVRHFVLLKGVLVEDSFIELAPYFLLLVKNVGKTCLTWKRIVLFY
jgi:hypothetical protein